MANIILKNKTKVRRLCAFKAYYKDSIVMVKAQISKTETRLDIKCQQIFNKGTNTIQ